MRASYRTLARRNPEAAPAKAAAGAGAKKSILPIVLGAGAAGAVAYFIFRKSASAALPPSSVYQPSNSVGISASSGGSQTSTGTTFGPNGADPSPSLVARLRGSDLARQIFFLQAYLYSIGFTSAIPDGIEGPVTDSMISGATQGAYTSYGPGVLTAVRQGVMNTANSNTLRNLPFTLPSDVIAAVQTSAGSVDPGSILGSSDLMVLPTSPTPATPGPVTNPPYMGLVNNTLAPASGTRPAGQMIPVAGYQRPPSLAPFNSVAGNPGWGVITDPNGINIGLWNALAGWQHAPLGTGNVATDVKRNPVAGQGGTFFDGYPYLGQTKDLGYGIQLFQG
jgi:hypothetical protein